MPTIAQIRAAVENRRSTVGPIIQRRQEHYFERHGRYWQGILTPGTPPDDGASVSADYDRRPTDQAESWADRFVDGDALPATLPAQISTDTYDGPEGHGYTVTLLVTKSGRTYARTWSVGPVDRSEAWRDVTPPAALP